MEYVNGYIILNDIELKSALVAIVDLFAVACLVLVLLASNSHIRGNRTPERKLFSLLSLSCIVVLLIDAVTWCVNGIPGLQNVNYVMNWLFFLVIPVPAFFWSLFVHYKVHKDIAKLIKILPLTLIPIAFNLVLLIYNHFYPTIMPHLPEGLDLSVFTISPDNIYQRGLFCWIINLTSYFYLLYSLFSIIGNRKHIPRRNYIPMLLFIVPPVVGNIIQMVFVGLSLVCMEAFSVIMLYIHVQNDAASIDHLTGLSNRRDLESYLSVEFSRHERRKISGIMLDIDKFKLINDTYGHAMGDDALVSAACILQESLGKNDFISRYAGDEFVVILETAGKAYSDYRINRIYECVDYFNETSGKPYKLTFSLGATFINEVENDSAENFVRRMDDKMYESKHGKQQVKANCDTTGGK